MKTIFKLILFLFFLTTQLQSQTIQIFHGSAGNSGIIENNTRIGTSKTYRYKQGTQLKIEIINAFPTLYEYEIKTDEIEIKNPESPEIVSLISILTSTLTPDITPSSPQMSSMNVTPTTTAPALNKKWIVAYKDELDKFKNMLKEVEEIIEDGDELNDLSNALKNQSKEGFSYVKHELKETSELFDILSIDDYVKQISELVKDPTKSDYSSNDSVEVLIMELFDNYFKTLFEGAKKIKSYYGQGALGKKTFEINLKEKIKKITIHVKSLNAKIKHRDTSDIITLEIIPKYNRKVLEVVPTILMHQSSDGKTFGINDGMITSSNNEEFNFSVGAILNLNISKWGQNDEYSLGTGFGFAVVEKTLDNFFFSTSVNYKNWVRFGVGYGFLRTATGLKNNLNPGDMVTDISDINDVTTFERKPAVFFTLIIPGLSLPISKK